MGGGGATTNPEIYKGYSPAYLYLVYIITKLFTWTGLNTLSFHMLLAFSVFLAIYNLLDRNAFAYIVAMTIILCPGYIVYQKILDPNSIPVLLSLPYVAFVIFLLKRKRLSFIFILIILALTLGFAILNWSAALIFIPYALLLLGMHGLNRRAVIVFIVLSSISYLLVVVISIFTRITLPGVHNTAHIYQFFSNYMWGKAEYYRDYNSLNKPLLVFCIVNIIGLLPLLAAYGYFIAKCAQRRIKITLLAIAIIAAMIFEIVILKNYFLAHHWMAAQPVLSSLVFSLALIYSQANEKMTDINKTISQRFFLFMPIIALLCFAYSLTIVAWLRIHHESNLALVRLVRTHTARSDTIMILNSDNTITGFSKYGLSSLGGLLDRKIVVIDTLLTSASNNNRAFLLSSTPLPAPWHSFASEDSNCLNYYWFKKANDWYNHTMVKRKGNYLTKPASSYFLYIQK
jgi:hypothetical protein